MTIRKKLTLLYAGLLTFIIVCFGATVYGVMRFVMIESIDRSLAQTANQILMTSRINENVIADTTNISDETGATSLEIAPLDVYRTMNVYVQVWVMEEGTPHLHESSANIAWHNAAPLYPDALGTLKRDYVNVPIDGHNTRILTQPITLNDSVMGVIQIGTTLDTINQASDALLVIMLIACAVAIFGGGMLSMWFSHRTLQPIADITKVAAKVAGTNDLSTRIAWNGPNDEVGRLISVFNHMMTRIEHLFSVQQRFVADMSHELRTPLTVIKGNLELVQRYGVDDVSLEAIESETERMSRLVNDLLMLARVDCGGLEVDLHPIDFGNVVKDAFEEGKLLAVGRDLDIRLTRVESMQINGNVGRIRQMVINLMSNAINFTPDGGKVLLQVKTGISCAILTIADTGIGIAPHDQERIFDRFYQSEPSRNHQSGEGFGLGLSIAKWIIDAHGGKIEVESVPDKGTTFTVRIPLYGVVEKPDTGELTNINTRLSLQRQGKSGNGHESSS